MGLGGRWGAVACALVVSGCVHRFECREHRGVTVIEQSSEHFDAVSAVSLAATQQELNRLERLLDAFSVFFGSAPPETERLRVFFLGSGGADEFLPGSGGYMQHGLRPLMVSVVVEDQRGESWGANAHELTHHLSGYWLPRQPRWISEGLANYLGDAVFQGESTVYFGRWRWIASPVVELERLWDWDRAGGTPDEETARYDSAWAYLHYLANGDAARLTRLWAALATAASARAGFESVFPRAEWGVLRRAVQAYVDAGRFAGWRSETLRTPRLETPRTLAPWEVHLARAELFANGSVPEAAAEELAVAEQLAPRPLPLPLVLKRQEDGSGGPRRTDELLELSRAPDVSEDVLVLLARRGDLSPTERLRFAETAATRAPLDGAVLAVLVEQALAVPGQRERALAASEALTRLAPSAPATWFWRTRALSAASRCREAQEALDVQQRLSEGSSGQKSGAIDRDREWLRSSCMERP